MLRLHSGLDTYPQLQTCALDALTGYVRHFSQSGQPDHHHHDARHHAQDSTEQPAANGCRNVHRAGSQLWRMYDRHRRPCRRGALGQRGCYGQQFLRLSGTAVPACMGHSHVVDESRTARASRRGMACDTLSWRRHQPEPLAACAHARRGHWRTMVYSNVPQHHQSVAVPRCTVRTECAMGGQRGHEPQAEQLGADGAASHSRCTAVRHHSADSLCPRHHARTRCGHRDGSIPECGRLD